MIDALAQMVADMEAADELYRPTHFWRIALTTLLDELAREGPVRFRSLPGPLTWFLPSYAVAGYHEDRRRFDGVRAAFLALALDDRRSAVHLERLLSGEAQAESDYRVLLAAGDDDKPPVLSRFNESTAGAPLEQFTFDGRRFSRASLNYLRGLAFLKRCCDTSSVRTVLEIGGGAGALGEIVLGDARCRYIDVDLPPMIVYARWYLAQIAGDDAVLGYEHTRDRPVDLATLSQRAIMMAPWQLPSLTGSVDLFVNSVSFQEMEPHVVKNYLAHVDRLGTRLVLLRNLREGKQRAVGDELGVRTPLRGDDYDALLPRYRLVATNTEPFGYATVDGFHSELRVYQRNDEAAR